MTAATHRWVAAGLFAGMFWACSSDGGVTTPTAPTPPRVVEIDIFAPDTGVTIGNTYKMIVVALDSSGHAVTAPALTWTSTNPAIATVSDAGVVSAIALGKTTIQAQAGTLTSTASVTVTPPPPAVIQLVGPAAPLTVGLAFQMSVTARDTGGKPTAVPPITWTSSNANVATVSVGGLVTAVAAGTTTITAQAGVLVATFDVIVHTAPGPNTIVINGTSTLPVGGTVELFLSANDPQGLPVSPPAAMWSSSNPSVATVSTPSSATYINITAVAVGTTTIHAQVGNLIAQLVMTVTPLTASDVRVSLLPDGELGDTILAAPGGTVQLYSYQYFATYPNQFVQLTSPIAWSSSRPDLATVSSSGLVTAAATGNANITATVTIGTGPGAQQVAATRKVKIAATPGSASVRLVNAGDMPAGLTLQSNIGQPVHLAPGDVHAETVPAGTFQLTAQEFPPLTSPFCAPVNCYDANYIGVQSFTGILPAASHATFVATPNQYYNFSVAPLWDWSDPVPADSAVVRLVLVTLGGYNVYFVDPGAPIGVVFLQGCYLDWPYGVTGYVTRRTGSFDIVLQPGKGPIGPESARITVTPAPGHATTYILTGNTTPTLRVLTLVDH